MNNNLVKRFCILLSVMLLSASAAIAESVPEKEARSIAERFFLDNCGAKVRRALGVGHRMTLVNSKPLLQTQGGLNQDADPAFYIFNAAGDAGYVIVSGEDRLPEVLGYSVEGGWPSDESLVPTPLKNALQNYAAYVEAVREGKAEVKSARPIRKVGESPVVAPLLTTKWDQKYPYNKYAPMDMYALISTGMFQGRYAIGCVAVAVGQVVNYWGQKTGFPAHPKAHDTFATYDKCYDADSMVVVDTIYYSLDPSTQYDYKNIPDSIGDSADIMNVMPQEEWEVKGEAVGRFLRDIAFALNMAWGESGGASYAIAAGDVLYKCFGFSMKSNAVYAAEEGGMRQKEYMDIIKANLDKGYPVVASGKDPSAGGHAFVYDGYDANDYVHVNWGWGGSCNNWFDLGYLKTNMFDAKEPRDYNFNTMQAIVYDIHPVEDGVEETPEIDNNACQLYSLSLASAENDLQMADLMVNSYVEGFQPIGYLDKRLNSLTLASEYFVYHKSLGYDYETELSLKNNDTGTDICEPVLDTETKNYGRELGYAEIMNSYAFDSSTLEDGLYTISGRMRSLLGGQASEWTSQMQDTQSFLVKGNHIVLNPDAYDNLYHAENCGHYLQDAKNMVLAHIEYDKDPENIQPGDSLTICLELECMATPDIEIQDMDEAEACLAICSDDGQQAEILIDCTDDIMRFAEEVAANGFSARVAPYIYGLTFDEEEAGHTLHLIVKLPFGKDGIMFTNDIKVASTTGIVEVKESQSGNPRCYNIAGQLVDSNYRGVVIQNGKKVVKR